MEQSHLIACLVIFTCGCILNARMMSRNVDIDTKLANYMLLTWTLSMAYYPCLWYWLVQPERLEPHLLPGLAWPLAIFLLHIGTNRHQSVHNEMGQHHGALVMESNSICSLALSIGGMLAAVKGSKKHSNLFMTALLLVVSFVLPSFASIAPHSLPRMLLHLLQKVAYNCAIGLLITGICMYVNANTPNLSTEETVTK